MDGFHTRAPMIPRYRSDSAAGMTTLFVAAAAFFWIGNDRVSLWDRDEPRYAETAKQMLRRGDYIVPYFNDQFRFQKPVMTYWLVAASYAVFGENDFAARAVSGLCLAAVALLIARLGDRMFGPPAGMLAAGMFCITPMAMILGKLVLPDGPQLLAATACMTAMYRCWRRHPDAEPASSVWPLVFWIGLSCSILIKGPIVLGMITLALLTLWLLAGVRPSEFHLEWKWGTFLAVLITAPWLIAVYSAVGPAFFTESVGNQIVRRLGESFDQRFLPPGYYAVTAILCLAPWTGFVLLALVRRRHRYRERSAEAFLLAWTIGPMILLELFRSKQPHYFAPAYPAMMLLAASMLAPLVRGEYLWRRDFLGRSAGWWPIVLGIGMAFALAKFASSLDAHGKSWAFMAAAALVLSTAVAFWLLERRRLNESLAWQAVGSGAALLILATGVLPAMDRDRVAKPLAKLLAAEPQQHRLVYGCIEPSFVYYGDRPILDLKEHPGLVKPIQAGQGDYLVATTEAELPKLQALVGRPARIEHTIHGWLRMHKDTVHFVRFGTPAVAEADKEPRR
jgi:4-amino-4-deoxy-L-arabinose transferase-like glycosyltransferase